MRKQYAKLKDAKRLKVLLDRLFNIDSDPQIIRQFIADLGIKEYEHDVNTLFHYRNILAGVEDYQPYEEENETIQ